MSCDADFLDDVEIESQLGVEAVDELVLVPAPGCESTKAEVNDAMDVLLPVKNSQERVATQEAFPLHALAEATAGGSDACSSGPSLADLRGRACEVLLKASLDGSILEAMSAARAQATEQELEQADNVK